MYITGSSLYHVSMQKIMTGFDFNFQIDYEIIINYFKIFHMFNRNEHVMNPYIF